MGGGAAARGGDLLIPLSRARQEAKIPLDATLLDSLLDEPVRQAWGGIHPLLMGGEYLPSDLPGETTIARISLRSTTGDVSEVRARPTGRGIRYRIVDEYETNFALPFDRAEVLLSLGELIQLIDNTQGMESRPGLVQPALDRSFGMGNRSGRSDEEWAESVRGFITVDSEFYPDLEAYFEAVVEEWLLGIWGPPLQGLALLR